MASDSVTGLYDGLPESLQTLALNAFGLRNLRRHRRWTRVLQSLRPTETWARDRQVDHVAACLRRVLRHAVEHVPHYRRHAGLANDLDDPACDVFGLLEAFPILTKEEILEDPDRFVSEVFRRRRLASSVTSGTTGTPLTTRIEPRGLLTSDALWWRRTVWAGHRPGDWIARLVGDPVVPLADPSPRRPWRVSLPDRRLYLSTYHLSRDAAARFADVLSRRRPEFVMGYPSALAALAGYLPHGAFEDWRPKAVLFSSEPMFEHQREAITALFRAPIRGLYGCAERVLSAAECEHGSYHLSLVDGYLEGQFGIRPAVRPAVMTGLLNLAMPLVRYRLGDDLEPRPDACCECGRTLPLMGPVVTKHEDTIVTPSGRDISPSILTWAFKDLAGVERSQIVQHDETRVEVILQAPPTLFEALSPKLRDRVDRLLFHEMDVIVTRAESVDVSKSGKSRFVVNRAGERADPPGA